MSAIFTTPPRLFDVTALFPQLAPPARTTTRLHPRPGSPTVHDSSVGGPLMWPSDEPWPHCVEPHDSEAADEMHSPDEIRHLREITGIRPRGERPCRTAPPLGCQLISAC
jgi:hypothetical protein